MNKYPGVDDFIDETGYGTLVNSSLIDVVRLAFIAGRLYEAERDRQTMADAFKRAQAE